VPGRIPSNFRDKTLARSIDGLRPRRRHTIFRISPQIFEKLGIDVPVFAYILSPSLELSGSGSGALKFKNSPWFFAKWQSLATIFVSLRRI
jgi:hypothetical protein